MMPTKSRHPTTEARCPRCGCAFRHEIRAGDQRAYMREYGRERQRALGAKPRTMPIDAIQEAMRITREDGAVTRDRVTRCAFLQLVRWLVKFAVPHEVRRETRSRRGLARGCAGERFANDRLVVPTLPHEQVDALVYGRPQRQRARTGR